MTLMEQEAGSTPAKIADQLKANLSLWKAIVAEIKQKEPSFAMTVARGSSDHAATFAKYVLETQLGLMTCSAAPSVFTLYDTPYQNNKSVVLGLSQSGQSPDLCETLSRATESGAVTLALVNEKDSPLAESARFVVPLHAGKERAVAATKSYIASLVALVQFTAVYKEDKVLLEALEKLPEALNQAANTDWSVCIDALLSANSAYVIGRGYGFSVAQEAALKFKETASIHAEAFSSAEVLHGPFALVKPQFPVLIFAQNDVSLKGTIELVSKMTSMGAATLFALPRIADMTLPVELSCSATLPLPESLHLLLDPIVSIQAFYMMAARLAVQRGMNPDQPDNLKKVTETR